ESGTAVATLRGESSIGEVLAAAARVELALVGIGSRGVHSSPHVLELMRLDASEREAFEAQRPVGDVCGRFVDAEGVPLGAPTDQRVLAVTFSELLRIPEVLGVAAGEEKAPGVVGVLRSGAIDTLVVDVARAREVLALRSRSRSDPALEHALEAGGELGVDGQLVLVEVGDRGGEAGGGQQPGAVGALHVLDGHELLAGGEA